MVAMPPAAPEPPVTRPVPEPMLAMVELLLVQVPLAVASASVMVLPEHNEDPPVIAAGTPLVVMSVLEPIIGLEPVQAEGVAFVQLSLTVRPFVPVKEPTVAG